MSAAVVDIAEAAYRRMIGKRVTLPAPGGRTITGKVLRGIYRGPTGEGRSRFRLRARETHCVLLSSAPLLRLALVKRRGATA